MENPKETLSKENYIKALEAYVKYVTEYPEEHDEGCYPACFNEWFNNEYQEVKTDYNMDEDEEIISAVIELDNGKTKKVRVGICLDELSMLIENEDTTNTEIANFVSEKTGFCVLGIIGIKPKQ